MATLNPPTAEQAERFSRTVSYGEAAVGSELSATAGQSPRRLTSVAMVGAFLKPIDNVSHENLHDTVNYVSPKGLAAWVTQTIGDAELGRAVSDIAEDGRAFGFQVRDLKPLIAERVTQYRVALGQETEARADSGAAPAEPHAATS